MSGGIFVFCETRNGSFRRVCGELLTQFKGVADVTQQPLAALVVGESVADEVPQLSQWGADAVFHLDCAQLADAGPEALAAVLTTFVRDSAPSLLVFGNTPLARSGGAPGRRRGRRGVRRRLRRHGVGDWRVAACALGIWRQIDLPPHDGS